MPSDYNVDDILEEIRRKKGGDTSGARDAGTYHEQRPTRQQEPPRRTAPPSRPASARPQPPRQPSAPAEPPRFPGGRGTKPRTTRPPSSFNFDEPVEPPRAPRQPSSFNFDEPVEPPRAPRRSSAFNFDEPVEPPRAPRRSSAFNFEDPAEPAGFGGYEQDDFTLPTFEEDEPAPPRRRTHRREPVAPVMQDGFTQEIDEPRAATRREAPDQDGGMVQTQWQQSMAAQELMGQQEAAEDDFTSMQDVPFVKKDIKSMRTGLSVKLGLTGICLFLSAYLVLSMDYLPFSGKFGVPEDFLLPLLPQIAPENNMRLFLIVNLLVCVLAAIVCGNVIGGGLRALFRLHADNDTPAALAILSVVIQGIVLVIMPDAVAENSAVVLYFPAAVGVLFCSLIGKKLLISRVERNFRFLISDAEKHALLQVRNRDFAREFTRGLGANVDRVAYSAKTDFLTGFLDRSYSSDYSEQISRLVSPLVLGLSLVVSVISGVLTKDLAAGATAFAGLLCVTAPFSGTILPQVMLGKAAKSLTRAGGMLTGYEAAEEFSAVNAVVFTEQDLFAGDGVMLHGMKVFAEKRIDEAILDAASVILSCDGIMSAVFLNMIGGNRRMLKKVDSLMYEDAMGLSAWVDGKRVLIGSQELMRCHGIDCPSKDFESRYVRDGRQVLYIANSGELSAMFVVSYNADPKIAQTLTALERRGVSLLVSTTDPNITPELLSAAFGIKRTKVRLMPAKLHGEFALLAQPKEKVGAYGCHAGGVHGVDRLLRAASAVKASVMRASMVQLIGIIVGYGLVSFMAFTGSLASASFGVLIGFSLAWLVAGLLAAVTVKL